MKKVLALLVSVFLLLAMIPMGAVSVSAAAIDLATFNSKLAEFKKKYPNKSTYVDNADFGGYECFGFANEIAEYMFGSYPTSSGSAISNVNKNWSITYGGGAVDDLAVGDVVRFAYGSYDHSIFVTSIVNDTIYYCQANVPADTNRVTYGNEISRSKLKDYVAKKLNGNSEKRGWVAHYKKSILGEPHLTIKYHANGGSIDANMNSDYYLSSSLVYRSSDKKVLTQVMTYGKTQPNGLWNAASFGLYYSGYQFVGWSTDANGNAAIIDQDDVTVKPEDIYPNLVSGSVTITLYAIWEKASCDHVPVVAEEGYAPTCTEDGLTDGVECGICGAVLSQQEVIPASGHIVVTLEGYEPTCTEDGLTEGEECFLCGEVLVEQEVIAALDHNVIFVEGYEPTCTEDGLSDGEVCDICGEILVEQEVIPATGHEADVVYGYEATCTEEGLTDGEECWYCGEVLVEQEVIPATGHKAVRVEGYEATCTEEGLTDGEECWYCGETLVEQVTIPAIGHKLMIVKGYPATCTEDGLSDGTECAVCGEVLVEQEDIYALGHAYSDHYDSICNECGEVREVPDNPNKPDVPVVPDLPADAPAFVVESTTAREGEEFTVAVRTERNSGIVSFKLNVSYDADLLELVGYEEKDFSSMSFGPQTSNPFVINWVDTIHPDNTTNGVVVLLTFRVKEGATIGETAITLSYDTEDVYDQNYNNVAFRVENGVVEIVEYTPGDVNNDGKVNNKDLGLLQQYLNGWTVTVSEKGADTNGDGKVNNKDLGLLQQYLNGWNVELG